MTAAIELNAAANVTADVDLPNIITEGTEIQMIPLKRLVASPYNQRTTKRDPATIEAFAANIAAVGLMQNLVVHAMPRVAKKAQTYGVDAGETRRQALALLESTGVITGDYLVPAKVIPEADAILYSAVENDMRIPPHPADQFDQYKKLVDSGRSAEFIAAVFKTTPQTVAKRLKLANVAPSLFALFREDKLSLEQMQALALSDDHAAQERVMDNGLHRRAYEIKRLLTQDEQRFADNNIARFVGVAAFEAAGGKVRRDLFGAENDAYFSDMELMHRLAVEQLQASAEGVRTEGWKWVEIAIDSDDAERSKFSRIYETRRAYTAEETARVSDIDARLTALNEEADDEATTEERCDAIWGEIDDLERERESLESTGLEFLPEAKQRAGVIIRVGHSGKVEISRGYVRAEDEIDLRDAMTDAGHADTVRHLTRTGDSSAKRSKGIHSETLLRNLTAHRTAAVQRELAMNPRVALVALVHRLICATLYRDYAGAFAFRGLSAVQISRSDDNMSVTKAAPELKDDASYIGFNDYAASWVAQLPKNKNEMFGWLLEQSQDRLLKILAVCTATSINGVSGGEQPHSINALVGALELDLSKYWQPTPASYFNHVSKDRIAAVVTAVVSEDDGKRLAKMKKGEAAAEAARLLEGRNWLPEFMASSEVAEIDFYDGEEDEEIDRESEALGDNETPVSADADESVDSTADTAAPDDVPDAMPVEVSDTPANIVSMPAWPFPTSQIRSLTSQQAA